MARRRQRRSCAPAPARLEPPPSGQEVARPIPEKSDSRRRYRAPDPGSFRPRIGRMPSQLARRRSARTARLFVPRPWPESAPAPSDRIAAHARGRIVPPSSRPGKDGILQEHLIERRQVKVLEVLAEWLWPPQTPRWRRGNVRAKGGRCPSSGGTGVLFGATWRLLRAARLAEGLRRRSVSRRPVRGAPPALARTTAQHWSSPSCAESFSARS
jgi:hypothetical protein